jgi:hypothetical protein
VETYPDFIYSYQVEQRSIEEQELNLSGEEKTKLKAALQLNASGNNRFYKYDFLFDNCATRIRDMVGNNTAEPLTIKNILPYPGISFRDLIHNYLNRNGMYWSKLGIDLLLGSRLDKAARNEQTMFLPDYLYKGFDSAGIGSKPLVKEKRPVYNPPAATTVQKPFFTPFIAFAAGLAVFIILSLVKQKWSNQLLRLLDFLLFFSTGLLGMVLVVMWTGTDHVLCRNNYNLLWAPPLHAIAAFFLNSRKKIMNQYMALCVIVYALLLAFWVILPQELNKDLVPLILLLIWRSWKQFKQTENGRKNAHV